MKTTILLLLLLVPAIAQEEEIMNALSRLGNVTPSEILSIYGNFTNQTPDFTKPFVVVQGNSTDLFEQEMAAPFMEGALVYTDGEMDYLTALPEWPFNLIIIGGPEHNSIARYIAEQGQLPANSRDSNRPKAVLQFFNFRGALVILISSSYSYPPESGVQPVEKKATTAATAVAATVAINAASVVVTQAAFPGAQILADILEFLKGGAQTYAEEVVEEKDMERGVSHATK